MVRHRAMDSAAEGPLATDVENDESQTGGRRPGRSGGGAVVPPFDPSIDLARYDRLADLRINGYDRNIEVPAVESGRRLICRLNEYSSRNDRYRAGEIARYLAMEAARVDGFNYKTALRRVNVQRYLDVRELRLRPSTLKDMRTVLFDAGRLVHPREYPPPKAVATGCNTQMEAASMERVNELYALAPLLPRIHSHRLLVMLDLCFGAGARPKDLKKLRGVDVDSTTSGGDTVALVRLDNTAGGSRTVPVIDPKISQRLIAVAKDRGPEFLLTVNDRAMTRNSVNKISEYLVRRGHPPVTAQALRHRWMLNLAATVPAALLVQLADVKDAKVIAANHDQLPTYGLRHAISYLQEAA